MSYSVDISDRASGAVAAIGAALEVERLKPAIGTAEVDLFRQHLLANPENAAGWPTTNYWPRAARATSWQLVAGGLMISIAIQGILQRFWGGEIHPVHAKYLTIPARSEAYGKRAGEFENLKVAWRNIAGKPTPWALVEMRSTAVSFGKIRKDNTRQVSKGEEIGEGVFFWLVKSVTQKGNPEIVPSNEEIGNAAMVVVQDAVERAWRK